LEINLAMDVNEPSSDGPPVEDQMGQEHVAVVDTLALEQKQQQQQQQPSSSQDQPAEEQAPKKESFMAAATSQALRPFVIISSSYLLFTVTDGAIRMIVLMHAYNKDFSALEVAIMFTLYELAGVFTNLVCFQWVFCLVTTHE
jgi:hypothetical protein